MAITTSTFKDLSDQNAVGTRMGTTSSDLICFYGATTAVAKRTVTGSISSGALASSVAQALSDLGLANVTFSA